MAINMGTASGTLTLDASSLFNNLNSAISSLDNFASSSDNAASSFDDLESSLDGAGSELNNLGNNLDDAANSSDTLTESSNNSKSSMEKFSGALITVGDKLNSVGKKISDTGGNLTKYITLPLAGLATGAVTAASGFESSMSQVQATMGITKDSMSEVHGETVNTMEALSAIAKQMGSETKFSAKESADALNYLALAGLSAEEQIDALPTVLTLAAAGNMDLAYASDLVTDSMSALGLETQDMTAFADQMAKTASNSNTSVAQLGEAILVVGGQARLCGLDTANLNTALGILADNGIKGSEGGTALRNTLKNLYTPTDKASEVLEKLGITTQDADGNLRGAEEVLLDLDVALSKLSEADRVKTMNEIFDTRTIAPASALLNSVTTSTYNYADALTVNQKAAIALQGSISDLNLDVEDSQVFIEKFTGAYASYGEDWARTVAASLGATEEQVDVLVERYKSALTSANDETNSMLGNMDIRWNDLKASVEDSTGAAQLMADTQLDNFNGQLTILKSQLEGIAIQFGELILPYLKAFADKISGLLTWISNLDDSQKKMVLTIAAVVAAVGPVLTVIGKVISGIGTVSKAIGNLPNTINNLKNVASGVSKAFSSLSAVLSANPIILIVSAIAALVAAFIYLWNNCEEFREFWIGLWESIKETFSNVIEKIQEIFHAIVDWFKDNWQSLILFLINPVAGLFKYFYDNFEGFRNFVDGILESIKTMFVNLFNNIKTFFTNLWNSIKSILSGIANWVNTYVIQPVLSVVVPIVTKVAEIVAKIWEIITALFSVAAKWVYDNVISPIVDFVSELVSTVTEFFQNLWDSICDIFIQFATWWYDNVISPIINLVSSLVNSIVSFFQSAWNGITNVFSKIGSWFGDRWNDIKNVFSAVGSWFGNIFSGAVDKIKEVFGKIKDWFSELWDDIKSIFSTAATAVADFFSEAFKTAFNGVMNTVENAVNFFVDGINSAIDIINKIPEVSIDKLTPLSLPRLAVGLDYVPYDEYQALLHKGERVLTKQENKEYTEGKQSGSGNIFIFNSPEPIDEIEAAKQFKKTQQELAEGF